MLIFIETILVIMSLSMIFLRNKLSYLGALSFSIAVSIPDIYYVPNIYSDMYRYFKEMDVTRVCTNIISLIHVYKDNPSLKYHSHNFVYNILQWLVAKTNIYTLLPFFIVLITYFSILIPFLHERNKNNFSIYQTFLGALMVISLFPYFNVSTTVRWYLASGLFFLVTYILCNSKNKKICLFLYIPIIFIHEAIFIPILVVVISVFIKRFKWYYYLFTILALMAIFVLIKDSTQSSSGSILSTAQSYVNGDVTFVSATASNIEFVVLCICPIVYLIGSILLIRDNKQINLHFESKLLSIFVALDIILIPAWIVAQRFLIFTGIIGVLIYIKIIKNHAKSGKHVYLIYLFSSVLVIFIMTALIPHFMSFDFTHIMNYID